LPKTANGASIQLTTILGQLIYHENAITDQQLRIDLSEFNKGVYLLTLQTKGQVQTYRIIKD